MKFKVIKFIQANKQKFTFPQMLQGKTSFFGVWALMKWFRIDCFVLKCLPHLSQVKTSFGGNWLRGVWERSSCCLSRYSLSCSFPQKPQIGLYRTFVFTFFVFKLSSVKLEHKSSETSFSSWSMICSDLSLVKYSFASRILRRNLLVSLRNFKQVLQISEGFFWIGWSWKS